MTPAILAVLLSLAPYHLDAGDSPEARVALLTPVAEAIASVARDPVEAAALIALGEHESRFARYVVEGRCLDGPSDARCDLGPDGKPRAVGPWQVWAWCSKAHSAIPGSSAQLREGAACAIRLLRSARTRCELRAPDLWTGAFSGYRGMSCSWPPATRRVQTMRRILAKLSPLPKP